LVHIDNKPLVPVWCYETRPKCSNKFSSRISHFFRVSLAFVSSCANYVPVGTQKTPHNLNSCSVGFLSLVLESLPVAAPKSTSKGHLRMVQGMIWAFTYRNAFGFAFSSASAFFSHRWTCDHCKPRSFFLFSQPSSTSDCTLERSTNFSRLLYLRQGMLSVNLD
jgi:hypothetical protein